LVFIWRERYVYVVLAFLSLVFLFWVIPWQVEDGSPSIVPYLSVTLILICSLVCLLKCLRGQEQTIEFPKATLFNLGLGFVFYLVYIYLIEHVGYYSLSILCIALLMWHLKVRNWRSILGVSVLVPLGIYIILGYFLNLSFPTGWLI
jgi:hypothetical protein